MSEKERERLVQTMPARDGWRALLYEEIWDGGKGLYTAELKIVPVEAWAVIEETTGKCVRTYCRAILPFEDIYVGAADGLADDPSCMLALLAPESILDEARWLGAVEEKVNRRNMARQAK